MSVQDIGPIANPGEEADAACVRRPNSTFTRCPCTNCRARTNRLAKAVKLGLYQRADGDQASAVLVDLTKRGWSVSAIADAYDLPVRYLDSLTARYRAGQLRKPGNGPARKILAGPVRHPRHGYVPALGTTRRLRALARMGWTNASIAAWAGVTQSVISDAQRGHRPVVSAETALKVSDAYARHSMERGPSTRVIYRATKAGWAPPLAWDNIDDPDESPKGVAGVAA